MPAHSRLKDGVTSLAYVAGIHVLMRVFRRDVLVGGSAPLLQRRFLMPTPVGPRRWPLKPETKENAMTKPSIVFAHGIWADGSCFQKLIPTLRAEGHEVMAAQYGLDTLKGDVDATIRTFGRVSGPIVLVGHSYGGTVITHAGMDPRVAALVYIAALGPDETETSQGQQDKFPKTDVFKQIEVADGRVWMKPDGVPCFAGDLSPEEQGVVYATHFAPALDLFPEAGWRRLAVEAELVYRGHRGSHCPS